MRRGKSEGVGEVLIIVGEGSMEEGGSCPGFVGYVGRLGMGQSLV